MSETGAFCKRSSGFSVVLRAGIATANDLPDLLSSPITMPGIGNEESAPARALLLGQCPVGYLPK